ncbi:hypothetical protein EVAR_79579_1 [Eumeta japonica]|uniref:Uncharacterized protein n=1 Tax=Eumeta variegata TaxID=151549 RepID=A0A4C1UFI4_EUMVA|nr:hypothetical protein EVAR_79579_1 [Eumeta japonica]
MVLHAVGRITLLDFDFGLRSWDTSVSHGPPYVWTIAHLVMDCWASKVLTRSVPDEAEGITPSSLYVATERSHFAYPSANAVVSIVDGHRHPWTLAKPKSVVGQEASNAMLFTPKREGMYISGRWKEERGSGLKGNGRSYYFTSVFYDRGISAMELAHFSAVAKLTTTVILQQ